MPVGYAGSYGGADVYVPGDERDWTGAGDGGHARNRNPDHHNFWTSTPDLIADAKSFLRIVAGDSGTGAGGSSGSWKAEKDAGRAALSALSRRRSTADSGLQFVHGHKLADRPDHSEKYLRIHVNRSGRKRRCADQYQHRCGYGEHHRELRPIRD